MRIEWRSLGSGRLLCAARQGPALNFPPQKGIPTPLVPLLGGDRGGLSGIALIGLIGAILIMALLGAGLLMLVNTGLLGTLGTAGSSDAFFAAETGISVGKAYIATNLDWYTRVPITNNGSIGRATYSAVITTSTVLRVAVITSTGRKDDAQWTSIWEGIVVEAVVRALVVYRETLRSEPRYRTYWSDFRLDDEKNALTVNSNPQWQRMAASPLTNEFLLVSQNSSLEIWGQVYTNGVWDLSARLNSGQVPIARARGFDVAYESLSGRGIVVYSIGTSNPQYRTWNGVTFSPETPINVGATYPIRWVRLVPKPDSNEIMCLARWGKTTGMPKWNASSAIIWNGSTMTWTNLQPLETNCTSEIDYETMDAAWSTNSAMVVYINGSTAAARQIPKYRTYTASIWSGENSMTNLGAQPRWMRVEFGPDDTNAVAAFLCDNNRLKETYWNGSDWGAYTDFGLLDTSTYRDFDIAWNSQANMMMVTYCKQNTDTHSYMLWTVGGSPIYGDMAPGTTDGQWSVLKQDPFTSEFLYMSLDSKKDVNVQRWNGVSWVLVGEVEDSSDTSYDSLGIAYRRDVAP